LMKVAIDSKKRIIYVKQICYQEGLAMSNIKKIMARNVTDELVVADSADLRGRIDLMEDGYNIFPAHKQGIGGIVSRIRAIMDYLIIIEDSPDVERELINYVWIDKRGEIPIDKFNHALDAMAYYFTHIRLQGNT
jgi:phage terminase large subunit